MNRVTSGLAGAGTAAVLITAAFLTVGPTDTITPTTIAYPISVEPKQEVSLSPAGELSVATNYTAPTYDSDELEFLDLINAYRTGQVPPLPALTLDSRLSASGDWTSQDLGQNGYFDHSDHCDYTHSTTHCTIEHTLDPLQTRNPFNRMDDFGYNYNTWRGENIAAGYSSGQAAFNGWRNSPGHNANMLGSHYLVLGISRVSIPGSGYGVYWTTDFGGARTETGGTPSPTSTRTPSPTPTR